MTVHDSWTLDSLIEAYKLHQRRTRGLREQTLEGYERFVRLLVGTALGADPIDPRHLSPSDVVEFVASLMGFRTWRLVGHAKRPRVVSQRSGKPSPLAARRMLK